VDDLLRGVPNLGTANPGSHRTHTKTVGEKEIVWKFPLAGAVPADVSLDVVDGKLILEYKKSEFGFTDSFKETLVVPADYAINKSQAALVNGLLTVAVPRTEKKHQKIEIRG
jgi:HSP20 family molecular chaperone IbpA